MRKRVAAAAALACALGAAVAARAGRVPEPVARAAEPGAAEARGAEAADPAQVAPLRTGMAPSPAEAPVDAGAGIAAADAVDPDVEAALLAVERLRALPGAAPRVDKIVAWLKGPGRGTSLARLPRGPHGAARLDAEGLAKVIPDPEILAAWRELAAIAARAPFAADAGRGMLPPR